MKYFPDWRNGSAYPKADAYMEKEALEEDPLHTSKSWAWQFLRRNHEYQEDSDKWFSLPIAQRDKTTGASIAEKYGLFMLIPYEMESPPAIPFLATLSVRSLERELKQGKGFNLQEFQLPLVFDLRFPIDDQLKLARTQIEEKIKGNSLLKAKHESAPQRRKRRPVYPRYLRVIDARNAGASFDEIAAQFSTEGLYHPNDSNGYSCRRDAERDYYRAKKFVEVDGYLGIAYS